MSNGTPKRFITEKERARNRRRYEVKKRWIAANRDEHNAIKRVQTMRSRRRKGIMAKPDPMTPIERRERYNRLSKKRHVSARMEALFRYSNGVVECACCGESNEAFLTIDHVNNDGNKYRDRGGGHFTSWLKARGWPTDVELQILCFNCNCARERMPGKVCPHRIVTTQSELFQKDGGRGWMDEATVEGWLCGLGLLGKNN